MEDRLLHPRRPVGAPQTTFSGPEAAEFLSSICINGFSKFPDGGSKHAIMLTDEGLIAAHALVQRDAEDRFRMFAVPPWAIYQATKSPLDVQFAVDEIYLFQIAGPTSLQTLERATGEDLRDIEFLRFRPTSVNGDADGDLPDRHVRHPGLRAARPARRGPRDLRRRRARGGRTSASSASAGGRTWSTTSRGGSRSSRGHSCSRPSEDPATRRSPTADDDALVSGSVDPADMRARYRTPVELDWHRAARFDHDFIGREALEAEVGDPKRTIVTLRWNPEDVIDI